MDLNALLSALAGKQYVLVGALIVGGLVASSKQGWLSAYLARKLPPAALPYLALALGVLGVSSTEIVAGKPIWPAIVDGISAGIVSVWGHQVIIEGMRSGKELVPEKKSAFLDPPVPPSQKEAS